MVNEQLLSRLVVKQVPSLFLYSARSRTTTKLRGKGTKDPRRRCPRLPGQRPVPGRRGPTRYDESQTRPRDRRAHRACTGM